jgi:D-alanyl-D-alanine dipeptidase
LTDVQKDNYSSIAMRRKKLTASLFMLIFLSCDSMYAKNQKGRNLSPIEKKMQQLGLVDILSIDPSLIVDLKYSSRDNFLSEDVYGDLETCYLQREVAHMLKEAHNTLKREYPRYRFIIYDGARPWSIQKKMWKMVKNRLRRYVANPSVGSNHNFGAAVDLSIVEINAIRREHRLLDMGTAYDCFGPLSQPRYEKRFLRAGLLSAEQIKNRRILRDAMMSAGFKMINVEWWHFNAFSSKEIRKRYQIIE